MAPSVVGKQVAFPESGAVQGLWLSLQRVGWKPKWGATDSDRRCPPPLYIYTHTHPPPPRHHLKPLSLSLSRHLSLPPPPLPHSTYRGLVLSSFIFCYLSCSPVQCFCLSNVSHWSIQMASLPPLCPSQPSFGLKAMLFMTVTLMGMQRKKRQTDRKRHHVSFRC